MAYLSFDKIRMTNLQESLPREILLTNRFGDYVCQSVTGCNIRKYNGLLVVPIREMGGENHVLLSSLDETVIQHGAEFNLGLHKYQGENYSPKGNKYIHSFEWDHVPTLVYHVGGVVLKKEIMLRKSDHRVMLRYTLLDAHSATTLRLRPMLAFRSVRTFTHKNDAYNGARREVGNGFGIRMYEGYPELVMQLSKKNEFVSRPDWYMGLDYPREVERGYNAHEDIYTPGYFEFPIKKGESVVFSAGLEELAPSMYKRIMDKELPLLRPMSSFYDCLVQQAYQFHLLEGEDKDYVIAGYPWFKCRARDFFVSMPGLTLTIGDRVRFEEYLGTALRGLKAYIEGRPMDVEIYEMDQPDVPLWACWAIQQFGKAVGQEACYQQYGEVYGQIIQYIVDGKPENLFLHENGLVYSNGREKPVTWMNSTVDGRPVVPRTGYIVEFNALWYNALCYWRAQLNDHGRTAEAAQMDELIGKIEASFADTFLNEYGYLLDYVDGQLQNWEVRPNQLFAVALDYSPLTREQKKSVLDICTRELLTPKGLRSLSPKSGSYNPYYAGPQRDRDLAYHQGTVWPWLMCFYFEAYIRVYKMSGMSFIERQLIGFEEELYYHCLGSIPELFDGNPPFHGRGANSFAMNVAGIIRSIRLLDRYSGER